MTRKRFIKLLMGLGIPRNDAELCARTARYEHGSYATGAVAFVAEMVKACKEMFPEIMPIVLAEIEKLQAAGGATK